MTIKPPWSVRSNPGRLEEFYVLAKGVPDWLKPVLWEFVEAKYGKRRSQYGGLDSERLNQLAILTRRSLPFSILEQLRPALFRDEYLFLDAVDIGLTFPVSTPLDLEHIKMLEKHLENARSEYTIGKDENGQRELQHRQPPELTKLVEDATSSSDRAARHLREAWSNTFSRKADLNAAGVAAVKAVEVAAKSVVIPDNPKATLGQIINAMGDKPEKWETDSEADHSIKVVVDMMSQVWKGHYRHGDETQPFEASAEGTTMSVHLAVVLVHWFSSGKIRRVN